ncbi:P-loop containing nucleoside triphosphate hydrolase protein [Hysterangium stoloniferum]|nr:P-loop containing nucleoside triphosphate hydrolase protein [Hysterangium stoloniferum]
MATKGLKAIAPVPTASDFLDIVLSKTQRKTPTVIHKNFKISRIRNFYMRKVKFTQDSFEEKLAAILDEFPILDDLHPFLSSLLNVLYDKNHYKLALGQLRTAKHLIDQVAKDYVRLLKFGDSLYRCKQLKRAALGRMATIMRRQKDPLAYLEQVRQHISRLPSIDPNTRTLLICGYPNVGKSSFINKVTRADVDVQPYAFTTKSLFVGHLDYKYLRWQVIDTPGILDHPLEEMNTIEMQSITALAHLRSCILYFMDLSEQCGYTVEAQCKLFHSIKPLFSGKPTLLVINKIDIMRPEDLNPSDAALLTEITSSGDVKLVQTSCYSEEGVMDVKNAACDALLAHRVETKLKGTKINSVANRIHVSVPKPRDDIVREPFIPDAVKERKKYDRDDPDRKKLERDIELEEGGAGVYNINLRKNYMLANDEWKEDRIPEIMDGKNIADFIDPDIAEKLEALEREEEQLQAEGFYDSEEDIFDSEDERQAAELANAKVHLLSSQDVKRVRNYPHMPRTAGLRTVTEMTAKMTAAGLDPSRIQARAEMLAKAQGAARKRKRDDAGETMDVDEDGEEDAGEGEWMDVDDEEAGQKPKKKRKSETGAVTVKSKREPTLKRHLAGMRDSTQVSKAIQLRNLAQRHPNRMAKAGESDRAIKTKMPKHLFAGKRKGGKTDRR